MHDLVIIGGGPAGTAAAVYAARKRLKSVLITPEWGGQSVVSPDVQNWIGTVSISGPDMAKAFKAHAQAYADDVLEFVNAKVTKVSRNDAGTFAVELSSGDRLEGRSVLIASGADRRRLAVPGADDFEHKGLTYCASCDGPLFSGMDVAVVGGGNAGFESAAQLLAYTNSVTLLDRADEFKADKITVEKVLSDGKMTAIPHAEPTAVRGEAMVQGLSYKDLKTGETKDLAVNGVFVEIGLIPNTSLVDGLVELDEIKRIKVDPRTQRTSVDGVWAAGDCTDELYHQNNIAAGDGVKALEDIYLWLKTR
jgi:alkyl hydroperoxide reductase subunit F